MSSKKLWYLCAGQGRTDKAMTIVTLWASSPEEAWLLFGRYFHEQDGVLPKSILCLGPEAPVTLWREPSLDEVYAELAAEYGETMEGADAAK